MTRTILGFEKNRTQNINSSTSEAGNTASAVIVGASLSGLMTAIALAQVGMKVTILERAGRIRPSGAGLQVDSGEHDISPIAKSLRKIASGGIKSGEAWSTVERRLRATAEADSRITLLFETRVKTVSQDEHSAWVVTDREQKFSGDILIGADGHRSIVRPNVDPNNPNATFAGYMIWIGIVEERDIPEKYRPNSTPPLAMPNGIGDFLLGAFVANENGSWKKGERRLGWAWYDNTKNDLLRSLGCVKGDVVIHSLNSQDIPTETLNELSKQAKQRWPQPWLSATLHSIETKKITGIPITEYVPDKLVNGRIALVGDAAHVPTPLTASGFNGSLQDAAVLAECLKDLDGQNATRVLAKYESLRLKQAQQIVMGGQSFSRSFARD